MTISTSHHRQAFEKRQQEDSNGVVSTTVEEQRLALHERGICQMEKRLVRELPNACRAISQDTQLIQKAKDLSQDKKAFRVLAESRGRCGEATQDRRGQTS